MVAVADKWIYKNGVLLYTVEHELRILDLHGSATTELVVDRTKLLGGIIEQSATSKKSVFDLLYFANDIVSCLYTHARPHRQSWLVVFNARENRLITVHRLETSYKIFVRNDDKFLFYGTHSHTGRDGFRRWILKAFDLQRGLWMDRSLLLQPLVGSDIGSTVWFEISDGYFYGVANSVSFEIEEAEWSAFYKGFRFPTDQSWYQNLEWAPQDKMWRRQHKEGIIDDRWTFLSSFKDEDTGQLRILESRKEWLDGSSAARRTYYMTDLNFRSAVGKGKAAAHGPQSGARAEEEDGFDDDDDSDDDDDGGEDSDGDTYGDGGADEGVIVYTGQSRRSGRTKKTGKGFIPPTRDPHAVHRGDDGDTSVMFTLSKCFIRSYYPSCHTFMDLVDDSPPPYSGQRIRIRAGSRRLLSPSERTNPTRSYDTQGEEEDLYKYEEVLLWPPEQDPENHDPNLDLLSKILNPKDHLGGVRGASDDRSIVYSTGGTPGSCAALVFLSFDAGIRLEGIPPYPGRMPMARPAGRCMAGHSSGTPHARERQQPDAWCSALQPELQHSEAPLAAVRELENQRPTARSGKGSKCWSRTERAMYRDIGHGYHFFGR